MDDSKGVRSSWKIGLVIALFLAFLLILAFGWPTLYRYDKFHNTIVRTNRFTGQCEGLTTDGWIRMQPSKPSIVAPQSPAVSYTPATEKPKIEYLGPLDENTSKQ